MPDYVPILKSKPAEIWAWTQASPAVLNASRVVFELVPTDTRNTPAFNFASRLAQNYPDGQIVTIDCSIFGQSSNVTTEISQELALRDIWERPVFRLDDTPPLIAQIRQACALHGQGACLRLGSDEDLNPDVPIQVVRSVLDSIGLESTQVDLIIDFRDVASTRDVSWCVLCALDMLVWARDCGPWRTVTVASGAFPKTISSLATGTVTPLERFDALLFASVLRRNPVIIPDFGDYGINYPVYGDTPPNAPNPNLRYTDALLWQVDRENRLLPGNDSFYTICDRTIQAPYWQGPNYSAGDREIERYSQRIAGPGTATNWLSFGESHHFAHVVDRLAILGVP